MIREVPYDPHIYFFGEEITMAARLWTHGYDIYHPPRAVVYHYWDEGRRGRRTHFNDHRNPHKSSAVSYAELNATSFARVRHLLGTGTSTNPAVLAELERYGLGTARSLKEYQDFCGVDSASRRIAPSAFEGHFPANQANGATVGLAPLHLGMACQPTTSSPARKKGGTRA